MLTFIERQLGPVHAMSISLGTKNLPKRMFFNGAFLDHIFLHFTRPFGKKTQLLGAPSGPAWAQDGPKTTPKLSPKSKRKNYRNMDRPGLHATLWGWTCAAPGAHRGDWRGSINQPKDPYRGSSTPISRWPGEISSGKCIKFLKKLRKSYYVFLLFVMFSYVLWWFSTISVF